VLKVRPSNAERDHRQDNCQGYQCNATCHWGERWNSATPGRGLKPTRDFPANPRRFPALAEVIWFGNPRFIDSKFSGQNLQTRGDDRHAMAPGM
jgi:hypothetical protein